MIVSALDATDSQDTQTANSQDTTITSGSPREPPVKEPATEAAPVSSKAAKLLGISSSSGPTNKTKSRQPSARRPNKPLQFRPARVDLEAGIPSRSTKDEHVTRNRYPTASTPDGEEGPGRMEEFLRKFLSRKRNVVLCLIFLFSVVIAVSIVSGFQGKNGPSAVESTQISKQVPQTTSSSSPSSSLSDSSITSQSSAASPTPSTSVDGGGISQAGVDGGQSVSSSLGRRMVVSEIYQGTAPAPASTPQ